LSDKEEEVRNNRLIYSINMYIEENERTRM